MADYSFWADGKPPNVVTQLPSVWQKRAVIPECPDVLPPLLTHVQLIFPVSQTSHNGTHDVVYPSDLETPCKGGRESGNYMAMPF